MKRKTFSSPLVLAWALSWPLWLPPATAQSVTPAQVVPQDEPTSPLALPALGDSAAGEMSLVAEKKFGQQIMKEIWKDPDYLDDPILQEYLDTLWNPLVAAGKRLGHIPQDQIDRMAFQTFLVRDKTINAFALPGGYVGVHLGLIGMAASRDELASVLAHEMSHVTQRHIARGMENSRKTTMLGSVAMILGVLAAVKGGNGSFDAANAAIAGSQALMAQGQLNFSRDMEREADRIGYSVLGSAGFAPGGMVDMFELLQQNARLNDSGNFPYLRSHPLTTERIGEAKGRLNAGGLAWLGAATASSPAGSAAVPGKAAAAPAGAPKAVDRLDLEHRMAQARARVLGDPRIESWKRSQARDVDMLRQELPLPERLTAAAESAFASTQLKEWARADVAFLMADRLLAQQPSQPRAKRALKLMQVQSLWSRGEWAAARAAFAPYATEASRVVLLQSAVMAAHPTSGTDEAKQAAEALTVWVSQHPQDSQAWSALSQVHSRLGERLRAIRAEAEARYAVRDVVGAVDRLRAAQTLSKTSGAQDHIDASIVDARMRTLEAERRQEFLENQRANQRNSDI